MSHRNDSLEAVVRRMHDHAWNTTIDVFEPTESATDVGVDVSVDTSGTPDLAGVEAHYAEPRAEADRDEGGTDVDLDALYYVRDDVYSNWDDFGETGEAATRIVDSETGQEFDVQTVVDARDGRLKLGCVEV